jgi:hypothetical protein
MLIDARIETLLDAAGRYERMADKRCGSEEAECLRRAKQLRELAAMFRDGVIVVPNDYSTCVELTS